MASGRQVVPAIGVTGTPEPQTSYGACLTSCRRSTDNGSRSVVKFPDWYTRPDEEASAVPDLRRGAAQYVTFTPVAVGPQVPSGRVEQADWVEALGLTQPVPVRVPAPRDLDDSGCHGVGSFPIELASGQGTVTDRLAVVFIGPAGSGMNMDLNQLLRLPATGWLRTLPLARFELSSGFGDHRDGRCDLHRSATDGSAAN